jgi:hypothetical protein
MIISDLNLLEAVEGSAIVGGTLVPLPPVPPITLTFNKNLNAAVNTATNFASNTAINDAFNKTANIAIKSAVIGNSASTAYDNEAIGPNSNTQAALNQQVVAGAFSTQNGLIVAAANT